MPCIKTYIKTWRRYECFLHPYNLFTSVIYKSKRSPKSFSYFLTLYHIPLCSLTGHCRALLSVYFVKTLHHTRSRDVVQIHESAQKQLHLPFQPRQTGAAFSTINSNCITAAAAFLQQLRKKQQQHQRRRTGAPEPHEEGGRQPQL